MSDDPDKSAERLAALVSEFAERRVVVVGDLVADQFVYGEISRVSREAPVLILHHERTETVPGGAANCAANLASLGARTSLVGIAGDDEPGRALIERLKAAGVDCGGVLILPGQQTTTKVRILAGHAHSTRQQVIRMDYEGAAPPDAEARAEISRRARQAFESADAFIVSDYNYGVASPETLSFLREAPGRLRKPVMRKLVLVDSRFRLGDFSGLTSATPNEDEVEQIAGVRLDSREALEAAGRELCGRLNFDALLITRGSHGMMLVERNTEPFHIEAVGAREAVDVTGAGDTVIATYTLALASGASYREAAHLANHAGGVVVMKRGTACVTTEELVASVQNL